MKTVKDILGRSPIHPFPARMAPSIALEAVRSCAAPIRVLDPMSGSGTVLAVAKASGHRAYGFDVDPLATLLSRVWTTATNRIRVTTVAETVLASARSAFDRTPRRQAYPPNADHETRTFVRYWFDPRARRELACLAAEIQSVPDKSIREVLWCGLSRMIITKSAGVSLARDLSHSRPHRAYSTPPTRPFSKFRHAVGTVVRGCPDRRDGAVGPRSTVKLCDARCLPIPTASIDLVVTSPPYLNAIDYLRTSKFALVWMGHRIAEIRDVRAGSVGTNVGDPTAVTEHNYQKALKALGAAKLPVRQRNIVARYARDMHAVISEIRRVLKPEGRAVLVIGDSHVRGVFVRNSDALVSLASTCDLRLTRRRKRVIPPNRRYMPPPALAGDQSMESRMRSEVVLHFSPA